MKQEEIFRYFKKVVAQLAIKFAEHNFRSIGSKVKSGLCRIEVQLHFYMDKHKKVRVKNELLAGFALDVIAIEPGLREFIDKV